MSVNRLQAMQLNAAPSETRRSREHPTKTARALRRISFLQKKIERLYSTLESCKTRWKQHRIARKLTQAKRELLDLRTMYAPKGSFGEPGKGQPGAGSTP